MSEVIPRSNSDKLKMQREIGQIVADSSIQVGLRGEPNDKDPVATVEEEDEEEGELVDSYEASPTILSTKPAS